MSHPALTELLTVATDAAYCAGRRTLAYFNTGVEVEIKADETPVTRADREAEELIRTRIARFFPNHSILGEEAGESRGDPDYRWIIDPIDGTKSFIHGVPLYGTMIGIEVRGTARVGAVYLPAMDEMICAAEGLGCFCNGRRAQVSTVSQLSQATLCTTSHTAAMAKSHAFSELAASSRLNAGWGDCYGYALVATGRAEIMMDPEMHPWDCAALLPILQEAGGRFTTWDGQATIWGPDAVATNAALNEQVLAIIRQSASRQSPPPGARS